MLGEALEHLVRGLVSNPDEVRVSDSDRRRPRTLEVRVHPEDIGKVIGRQGRTASALRTVVAALADRETVRVDFVDVDRRNQRRRP
ncbi:MAG TPA: RNA-binding protein [Micropruina sp.]|nr:RNA-binding protein [Micropruina sp.]